MITNDPDTPGAHVWEINVAAVETNGDGSWSVDAPDLDINYGLGARMQLSIHLPWAHQRIDGDWVSGAGDVELGVRWRFLGQERAGIAMAIHPMWIQSVSRTSRMKGLSVTGPEFVLPLQVAHRYAHRAIGAEVARHFVRSSTDQAKERLGDSHIRLLGDL